MPLRLHGIVPGDAHESETPDSRAGGGVANGRRRRRPRLPRLTPAPAPVPEPASGGGTGLRTSLVPFRDLCAVVSELNTFTADERTSEAVALHRAVVDAAFRRGAVLPAPVGVVFRSPDVLKRWMELHYVSLTDALEFVTDRAVARVHIVRAEGRPEEAEVGSDLAAAASESLRVLRRRAVASVPIRLESVTGLALSAAFLVEDESWKDFVHAVDEQRGAQESLRFDLSGPWAPYDFVHMRFGA